MPCSPRKNSCFYDESDEVKKRSNEVDWIPWSRRALLERCSLGFGALAVQALGIGASRGANDDQSSSLPSGAGLSRLHHAGRVKHVILCYMSGGVSHVDSFDPKPRLKAEAGQPMPMKVERTQFNDNGRIMPSPFPFSPSGESGIPISSLFPYLAREADELAVVRSMTTAVNEHAQGNFFAHSGFAVMGYPSAGAWISYGLGAENESLPGYVVLQSGGAVPPHGGVGLFSNGFLPAHHQGSILQIDQSQPVFNIRPQESLDLQTRRLKLTRWMDDRFLSESGSQSQVDAAIRNAETAARMQTSVPELCDLSSESMVTKRMYGLESTDREVVAYGQQCLLARRLVERGVRFIELSCLSKGIGAGNAPNPWDQHGDLERGHAAMAMQVDQPIAGLIADLRGRGLLEETLIVWTGEFGRTPFSQGSNGRDHNPFGFSVWMAGAGIRGGTIYGATDEYGYHVVENPTTFYDLWATVLHLMGVDHERFTYRTSGRNMRLTDVHGNVLRSILS